jgi:hypothetical protein
MGSDINLQRTAAPMVNQSDLPFRLLVRRYGATAAYTQMYNPHLLLNDQQYLEYHIRDLGSGLGNLERPVVAQLCGNDPDIIVQAGRKLQGYCDAIGELKYILYVLFIMTINGKKKLQTSIWDVLKMQPGKVISVLTYSDKKTGH